MRRYLIVTSALTALLAACSDNTAPTEVHLGQSANPNRPGTTVIVYDTFEKPGGYMLADYDAKWAPLGLGEMALEDPRRFDNGTFSLSATPFRTGAYVRSGEPHAAKLLQGRQAAATLHMIDFAPGVPHTVAIRFTRDRKRSLVEYFLDCKRVSKVDHVGIPLDVQG